MDALLKALKSVAEPTRLRILALCARSELTVSDLVAILGQSQPRVSRHLRLMVDAGILRRYREGAWAWYGVSPAADSGGKTSPALATVLARLVPWDDPGLLADLTRLEAVRQERARVAEAYFSQNAPDWDAVRALHVDQDRLNAAILQTVTRRPPGRLLDIGTGTGETLTLLAPLAGESIGIDLSPQMLAMARARLDRSPVSGCAVRQADMYHLPYGAGRFDCAVMNMVLHYAEDPAAALREAARVLAPGGMLLVVDFAPHRMESLLTEHAHRRPGFSDSQITDWTTAAGLSQLRSQRLPGAPLTVCLWTAWAGDNRTGEAGL